MKAFLLPSALALVLGAATAQDETAVEVDGHAILVTDVDGRLASILEQQAGGQRIPPQQVDAMRAAYRPQVIEALIDEYLLDMECNRIEIALEEEEYLAEMQGDLNGMLVRNGMSRADFAERVEAAEGLALDEFVQQRCEDPLFRQAMRHIRLMEREFADELVISDDELKVRYERDLEGIYSQPEAVRASHILIDTRSLVSADDKGVALVRAEAIAVEASAEGADFAALAREHSEGPSGPTGGDLGFFPRSGAMVEPFAAAAYELDVGGVSGIVETQFGYHIIMVTDRRDASVIAYDDAEDSIRRALRAEKLGPVRADYVLALRESVEIVYPEEG